MDSISRGEEHCEKLLGCYKSKTDQRIPQAVRRAEEEVFLYSFFFHITWIFFLDDHSNDPQEATATKKYSGRG
jgi:hypothetical protein